MMIKVGDLVVWEPTYLDQIKARGRHGRMLGLVVYVPDGPNPLGLIGCGVYWFKLGAKMNARKENLKILTEGGANEVG